MHDFHPLRIREKILETPECVSLSFDVPEKLSKTFAFKPGQYLTLKTQINGEEVRRSYSICTAPHEGDLKVAVKRVVNGKFSNYAMEQLEAGQSIEVMPPDGGFVRSQQGRGPYVFFAAGSGITPIMSLIKDVLEREAEAQILLFYGNKASDLIIFKEEIESLKNQYLERFQHYYFLTQEVMESDLFTGRINADKLDVLCKVFFKPEEVKEYFICGPESMIFSLKDALTDRGVEESRVRFELFTTSKGSKGAEFVGDLKEEEQNEEATVTIILDGQESQFQLGYKDQSVLDAALSRNHDLPFACKGGVCCTCKAKLLEGKVQMEVNYALEPDEVEAGYILTCQSHPRSKELKVDYDV